MTFTSRPFGATAVQGCPPRTAGPRTSRSWSGFIVVLVRAALPRDVFRVAPPQRVTRGAELLYTDTPHAFTVRHRTSHRYRWQESPRVDRQGRFIDADRDSYPAT
jgi:hypothetical protein